MSQAPIPQAPIPAPLEEHRGRAVAARPGPAFPPNGHRAHTLSALARRLERFIAGTPGRACDRPYWVPGETLCAPEAQALSIAAETDLFGGVVAHEVQAGKAITHPLVSSDAAHPEGWCPAFCTAVRAHVLPGFSAFAPEDVLAAGARLLGEGPVRLKPAGTDGGMGQSRLDSLHDLDTAIARLDPALLARHGLVLEPHLEEIVTFSVGRLTVGGRALAYVGTQWATPDAAGRMVYGGSRLHAVQGDFSVLAAAPLDATLKWILVQAHAYDLAADAHLPGFFASRRNYDVALGRDGGGKVQTGVLEASWRAGGASGAELAALHAFADDPDLVRVVASCHERYGKDVNPPKDADVYCALEDPVVGFLTKYAVIEDRHHA